MECLQAQNLIFYLSFRRQVAKLMTRMILEPLFFPEDNFESEERREQRAKNFRPRFATLAKGRTR